MQTVRKEKVKNIIKWLYPAKRILSNDIKWYSYFKVILQKNPEISNGEDVILFFITGKMTSFQKLVLSLCDSANHLNWSFT